MKTLLLLFGIAGLLIWFWAHPAAPTRHEASEPIPSPTPSVTITELLQPLYDSVFGQDQNVSQIVDCTAGIATASRVLYVQPVSNDAASLQVITSAQRLCSLMQQAITCTTGTRQRMRANQFGHPTVLSARAGRESQQFFGSAIEREWHDALGRLRNQAAPVWAQLVRAESTSTSAILPGGLLAEARSEIATATRSASAARQQQKTQAEQSAAAAAAQQAAQQAAAQAAPPSHFSFMRRNGLGGD